MLQGDGPKMGCSFAPSGGEGPQQEGVAGQQQGRVWLLGWQRRAQV